MSFFKRLLSPTYRRALEAEARGDHDGAARAYALAGEREKVAEMNLLRAEASTTRKDEVDALRAACQWAAAATEAGRKARRRLADALRALAAAAAVPGEPSRLQWKEAAALFAEIGLHGEEGECLEALGEDAAASRAFGAAGLIERMEQALARDEQRDRKGRRLREAFDEYQLEMAAGDRELALSALRLCIELSDAKGDYRRLCEQLEARRIASGVVKVTVSRGEAAGAQQPVTVVGLTTVRIGREPAAELPLRGNGVSRWHAEVVWKAAAGEHEAGEGGWWVRDAGSRNGTRIAGARIEGELPVVGEGSFELGDDSEITWHEAGSVLRLEVRRGMDRGRVLVAGVGRAIKLPEGAAHLRFRDGRPYLELGEGTAVRLNGGRTGAVVQLVRGDVVEAAGFRYQVAGDGVTG